MLTIAEFAKLINRPSNGEGLQKKFYKIDEKWGLKIFPDRSSRDWEFEAQQKAANYGLAPVAHSVVNITGYNPYNLYKIAWGMITEIVPSIICDVEPYCHLKWGWYEGEEWMDEWASLQWKRLFDDHDLCCIDFPYYNLTNLYERLMKIGFSEVEDLHYENVGYMNDGRFVTFDFDHCAM